VDLQADRRDAAAAVDVGGELANGVAAAEGGRGVRPLLPCPAAVGNGVGGKEEEEDGWRQTGGR
jgi:hypothetical protein